MDLKQIYTYIIDKGNLFGIVCVVVIIVVTALLSTKTITDTRFTSLLKFLNVFVIASFVFILVLKLFGSISGATSSAQTNGGRDTTKTMGGQTKLMSASALSTLMPRTFVVNKTTNLLFSQDENLLVLQKEIKSTKTMEIDTAIDDELEKISEIKVDDEDQALIIYYNGTDNEPYKFDVDTNFDEMRLHSYLNNLETAGYKVKYEHYQIGFFHYLKIVIYTLLVLIAVIWILGVFMGGGEDSKYYR